MLRVPGKTMQDRGLSLLRCLNRESVREDIAKACFSCLASVHDSRRRHVASQNSVNLRLVSLPNCGSSKYVYTKPSICSIGQSRSISWLPEAVQNFSIWGGTGVALKALHFDGAIPYWACFALMSTGLRTALLPLVAHGATTSARFAKVAPELQFIVTLFQNDLKKMRTEGKSLFEQRRLFLQNLQTVRSIYQLHKINPLVVFLSPLMQIPFFYYVAIDLRKIVNGQDPELAQELTESTFFWVPDLTDPDPWFGLPIAAGAMLYANVEMAVGRRSLSGPTTSKSDFASLLKDLFQTLAVLMPCLAAQSPAGLQIYLVSSFTWTLFQGAALRNDTIRGAIGLPSMDAPPTEAKFAKEFMEFKKLEQKAKDIRGEGPVLGRNVLAVGFETSFPGTDRPSTIQGSGVLPLDMIEEPVPVLKQKPRLDVAVANAAWGDQFVHGISASLEELESRLSNQVKEERVEELAANNVSAGGREYMVQTADETMEAANLGVVMAPKDETSGSKAPQKVDPSRFKRTKGKKSRRKR